MPTKPSETHVHERLAPLPGSRSFNPVGELKLEIENRLAAFDEDLMTDPLSTDEEIAQTLSRILGLTFPIAALVVLYGAISGTF